MPYGTILPVRLTESLSSELNEKGDTFLASLASPILVGDRVVIPEGAGIKGRVVEVQSAGRLSGRPAMIIEVTRLAYNGNSYDLRSNKYSKEGPSRNVRSAATIGGGAGLGAVLGGILGGGKGAAIGAMIGAGDRKLGLVAWGFILIPLALLWIVVWGVARIVRWVAAGFRR